MKRKLMAVALGASMIASMMSVGAFAEESEVVANGDHRKELSVILLAGSCKRYRF